METCSRQAGSPFNTVGTSMTDALSGRRVLVIQGGLASKLPNDDLVRRNGWELQFNPVSSDYGATGPRRVRSRAHI
jgi:hypothetical protein